MLVNNNIYIKYDALKNVTQYLHILTGAQIAILDSEGRTVYGSPDIQNEYCSLIAEKCGDLDKCMSSDKLAAKQCKETFEEYSYICHAGIGETIVPLTYEQKIYLYVMIGQYINKEHEDEHLCGFRNYCKNKESVCKDLACAYDKLPKLSTSKLRASIEIVKLLFVSLWENDIVKVRKNDLFLKIEKYIDDNISEMLTVHTICEHFFISKNYLYRLFEQYSGLSVKKFIINKRILLAKNLLESSNDTITEISQKVGIPNYNVFIQLFKNDVGISPAKYRKIYASTIES